jgi:hypothetical protein
VRQARATRTIGGLLVCQLVAWSPSSAATLSDRFQIFLQGRLAPITDSFARAVGRTVPVIAASPALNFDYDPESGAFTRREATGGQLFIEHTQPLGEGHIAVGVDYLHVQFDRLSGRSLKDLHDPIRVDTGHRPLFAISHSEIDVTADQALVNVTYGLLGWLDLNAALPLVYTSLGRNEVVTVFPATGGLESMSQRSRDVAFGVGDLQLRTKAEVASAAPLSLAGEVELRLPTGREADFAGTGDFELTPTAIVSTSRWKAGEGLWLQGHLNLSMLIDVDDPSRRSEGRWGLGLDAGGRRWQLALGLLGREPTGPLFSSEEVRALTTLACIGSLRECRPVAPPRLVQRRTFFGFSGERADYVDASVGFRTALWTDRITGVVGMLAPLLDEGLVTEPIPVIGVEIVL